MLKLIKQMCEAASNETEGLIKAAALAVEQDMKRRPIAGASIYRFDRIIGKVFGDSKRSREFWLDVERQCRVKNAGKDTWDAAGYGIVASFAQTIAAYATPGFAAARRNYMT